MENNSLYKQYLNKGKETVVWNKILSLKEQVFEPQYLPDVLLILETMMERAAYNFGILVEALPDYGYVFENIEDINPEYNIFQRRGSNGSLSLDRINSLYNIYGHIPYSLAYYYKTIKEVDFRGNFPHWDAPFYLDQVYIYSFEVFLEINSISFLDDKDQHFALISPDEFVKENVSGSMGYGVLLSQKQMLDAPLINFGKELPFIDYLRLCFKWCGLVGLAFYEAEEIPAFITDMIDAIRPKLMSI